MASARPLPGWPAVLDAEWAAAYLSLSETTFYKVVVPAVPAIQLTVRRVGWARAALDNWIAERDGGSASLPLHNPWDDE